MFSPAKVSGYTGYALNSFFFLRCSLYTDNWETNTFAKKVAAKALSYCPLSDFFVCANVILQTPDSLINIKSIDKTLVSLLYMYEIMMMMCLRFVAIIFLRRGNATLIASGSSVIAISSAFLLYCRSSGGLHIPAQEQRCPPTSVNRRMLGIFGERERPNYIAKLIHKLQLHSLYST